MLQYFYDDEVLGVIDISLRCRLYRTSVKSSAEEGEASISTLIVDDPAGNLILNPFRQIYIMETTAPTNEKVVYRGYISDREIRRGPYRIGAGREWVVQLSDPNWLIGLRIVVGSDANRPVETDLERVQWLLTTTEANTFNGDDTYVSTTAATVNMDAADYRGQNVTSILDDCAQATGKNWWVVYFEAIGQYGLWYDYPYSTAYVSDLSLSNDLAEIDNSTVFAFSQENTVLERSPSRLVSGVYLPYDGGNVYVQNPVIGSNFIFRDAAAPSVNVKTAPMATARANRYLADNETEDDVIRTEVILPAAQVNDIMHGMLMPLQGSHLPGYEDYTNFRVLNRTVTETSEEFLTVGLELSPMVPPITPFAVLYRAQTADGGGVLGWACAGDNDGYAGCNSGSNPTVPTVGPLHRTISDVPGTSWPAHYRGFEFDGTGTVDIEFGTTAPPGSFPITAYGAATGYTLTVDLLLNGVVIGTTATGPTAGGSEHTMAPIILAGVAVEPGDLLTARMISSPSSTFYIDFGELYITGGSLIP